MKKLILSTFVLSVVGLAAMGQVQAASYPLYAGRNMEVGTVDVTSDGTNIDVAFQTTNGWTLVGTYVQIAGALREIPHTRCGNPIPAWFEGRHGWVGCEESDSFTFPIGDLGGQDVYVAAHAIVARLGRHHRLQIEGAWAGAERFPGRCWARYIAIPAEQWVSEGTGGWDVTGEWTFSLFGGIYPHDLTLTLNAGGVVTGDGHLMTTDIPPVEAQAVTVTGTVADDVITLTVVYPDSGGYSFTLVGTIAEDGTMSGTCPELLWDWETTDGAAQQTGGGLWTLL